MFEPTRVLRMRWYDLGVVIAWAFQSAASVARRYLELPSFAVLNDWVLIFIIQSQLSEKDRPTANFDRPALTERKINDR
jgi:hypothetical protein